MGICGLVSGSYGAALVIQTAGCALLKGNEQIDYLFIYLFIYFYLFQTKEVKRRKEFN